MKKYLSGLVFVVFALGTPMAGADSSSIAGDWSGNWKIHGSDGFNVPVTVHLNSVTPGKKPGTFNVTGELEAPESSRQTGFKKVKLAGKIKRGKLVLRLGEGFTNLRFVMKLTDGTQGPLSGWVHGRIDDCKRTGKLNISKLN